MLRFFVFFKQKTAYEIRISDWSSDVCSSDLPFGGWIAWNAYDAINLGGVVVTRGGGSGVDGPGALAGTVGLYSEMIDGAEASLAYGSRDGWDASASVGGEIGAGQVAIAGRYQIGSASCRERGCQYV